MRLRLRDGHAGDLPALVAILLAGRAASVPALDQPDTATVTTWLQPLFESPDWEGESPPRVRIAERDGRAIGFAVLERRFTPIRPPPDDAPDGFGGIYVSGWELTQLYVVPDARRAGVGSALLADAIADEPRFVDAWVFAADADAHRFMERHGFTLTEESSRLNQDGDDSRLLTWPGPADWETTFHPPPESFPTHANEDFDEASVAWELVDETTPRPPITPEPATRAEAPRLAHVYMEARRAIPGLHEPYTRPEVARWIADELIDRHQVRAFRTLMFVHGYIGFGLDKTGEATVFHLYVQPSFQLGGIGTALLRAAQDWAPNGRLRLRCFEANRAARAFYERLGFKDTGRGDGSGNAEGLRDILYEWRRP